MNFNLPFPKPRHPCLPTVLALIEGREPAPAIWAAMRAGIRFTRAGDSAAQSISGFGVEGRGLTRDEAASQWLLGARDVLDREDERQDEITP